MVTRRRPSGSHYAKISKGARNATLGSHIKPPQSPSLDFGGSRRSARKSLNTNRKASVRHGEISQVLPSTSTRESERAYQNRINQRDYTTRMEQSHHRRTWLAGIASVLLVLVLAAVVSLFVYAGSVNDRLSLDDKAVTAALADASGQDGVSYALLAGGYSYGEADAGRIDEFLLVRTDTRQKTASVVSIPGSVTVKAADGKSKPLGDIASADGDAAAIEAVEGLSGVQFAHYARLDGSKLADLVDKLGGLTITLPEEIDDPSAGPLYLPVGTQTLSGEQVLYVCRAANMSKGVDSRSADISLVAEALARKVGEGSAIDTFVKMDEVADCIRFDSDIKTFVSLVRSVRDIPASSIMFAAAPVNSVKPGVDRSLDADPWSTMMQRFAAGENPVVDKREVIDAVDKSFTIEVRNGASTTGAAAEVKAGLEQDGFTVATVGNADSAVYDETLIIYRDGSMAKAAEAVAASIGVGRTVQNSVHYQYNTDVLVVIGKDWQPKM